MVRRDRSVAHGARHDRERARRVDTAQNTADKPIVTGQLDLVTVAKQLLGHDNTGAVKANPVDFEVAITHNHGDHTGKAVAMAPRKVYFPDGDWPNNAPAGSYKLAPYQDATPPGPAIDNIKTGFYLIRDNANTSMYLIKGSTKALLVGTGSGTPGIAAFAKNLAGTLPLEVIVTSNDRDQIGGLSLFAAGTKIYAPRGSGVTGEAVGAGDVIDLGVDPAGRPARIEVQPLPGHSKSGITLLDVSDRALLSGDALGEQFNGGGLVLHDTLTNFDAALKAWRAKTDGRYDVVYTAHNYQWFTSPAFVDQTQQAVTSGLAGGATLTSTRPAGYPMSAPPARRTSSPRSRWPSTPRRTRPVSTRSTRRRRART
jgi:glyoxylase-like metal-dependent hydrolase (beta-lactamase superfamily II)